MECVCKVLLAWLWFPLVGVQQHTLYLHKAANKVERIRCALACDSHCCNAIRTVVLQWWHPRWG